MEYIFWLYWLGGFFIIMFPLIIYTIVMKWFEQFNK